MESHSTNHSSREMDTNTQLRQTHVMDSNTQCGCLHSSKGNSQGGKPSLSRSSHRLHISLACQRFIHVQTNTLQIRYGFDSYSRNTFYSHEKIVHEQNEPSFQYQWCTFESSGITKQYMDIWRKCWVHPLLSLQVTCGAGLHKWEERSRGETRHEERGEKIEKKDTRTLYMCVSVRACELDVLLLELSGFVSFVYTWQVWCCVLWACSGGLCVTVI